MPAYGIEGSRSDLVAEPPRIGGEGCAAGDDRHEHACAESGATGPPAATGSAGHLFASTYHLGQCLFQIDLTTGVVIGCEERGTYQDMMFGAVHVAKRHRHHMFQYLDWRSGGFLETIMNDGIDACGVAFIAHIMAFDTLYIGYIVPLTEHTFHSVGMIEILQR